MEFKYLEINGKTLKNVLVGDEYVYNTSEVVLDVNEVEGRSKDLVRNVEVKGVEESIPIVYINTFNDELKTYEEAVDELVQELKFGKEEVKVSFTGSEYYREGIFHGVLEVEPIKEVQGTYSLELSFKMTSNLRSSKTERGKEFTREDGIILVYNEGERVEPEIDLEALEDTSYVAIRNLTTGEMLVVGRSDYSGEKRQETVSTRIGNSRNNVSGKKTIKFEDGKLKPNR